MAIEYENRMCIFMDILGFGKLVEKSVNEPPLREKIYAAVQTVSEALQRGEGPFYPLNDYTITYFSDNLVISSVMRGDAPNNLLYMLSHIYGVLVELFELGFLIRGGLSIGELVHTDTHLFGPALNHAVKLEKEAFSPRIISDRSLTQRIASHPNHGPGELALQIFKWNDGLKYLSIDRAKRFWMYQPDRGLRFLERLRACILSGLDDPDKSGRAGQLDRLVTAKYEILRGDFNSSLVRLQESDWGKELLQGGSIEPIIVSPG